MPKTKKKNFAQSMKIFMVYLAIIYRYYYLYAIIYTQNEEHYRITF